MNQSWDDDELEAVFKAARENPPQMDGVALDRMRTAALAEQARLQWERRAITPRFWDEIRDIFVKPVPVLGSALAACCGVWLALYPAEFLPDIAMGLSGMTDQSTVFYALYEELEVNEVTP